MRSDQVAEVLGQLGFGERVDLIGEVSAQTPDGAGVGVNGIGLEPLEFEVLKMQMELLIEVHKNAVLMLAYPHDVVQNHALMSEGVRSHSKSCAGGEGFLRGAASSNWAVKRTPTRAMASPLSWPLLVPFSRCAPSGAAYLGRYLYQ